METFVVRIWRPDAGPADERLRGVVERVDGEQREAFVGGSALCGILHRWVSDPETVPPCGS